MNQTPTLADPPAPSAPGPKSGAGGVHGEPSHDKSVVIIGAGIGGLSLGIRLQSLGFRTTIVEALDAGGAVPGARALTFRELAARIGGNAELGPLLVAAPLVERIVYAPGAPPEADVVTAERQLDRVVLAR